MTEDNRHTETEKLFHDALANWEAQPSPALWDKVEAKLDGDKRRPAIWVWLLGACMLVAVITSVAWYLWPVQNIPRQYVANSILSEKLLDRGADSVLCVHYLADDALSDSVKQNIQMQADSINNNPVAEAVHNTSGTTPSKPAAANNTHIVEPTAANTARTTSLISSVSTKKNTGNTGIRKSNSLRKDSASGSYTSTLFANTSIHATNTTTGKAKKATASIANSKKQEQPALASTKAVKQTTTNELPGTLHAKTNTDSITKTVPQEQTTTSTTKSPVQSSGKPGLKNSAADSASITQKATAMAKKKDSVRVKDSLATRKTIQQKPDSVKADSAIQTVKKDSAKKDSAKKATAINDSTHHALLHNLFAISIYYSPEIARNDVTSHNTAFNIKNAIPDTRYAMGIKFHVNFSDRFEFNAGFSYSQFNQTFSLDTTSFSRYLSQPFIINTSLGNLSVPAATLLAGYSPGPTTTTFHIQYKYSETVNYINMPLNARLNLSTGKLKPYITAGINLQYAISESAILDIIKDKKTDVNFTYSSLNVNKLNAAFSAGIGVEYHILKRISIYVEPNGRLNTLALSSDAKSLNYYLGCQGGIRIGL